MDRLLTVAACALLGALAFGVLGALWGGVVRAMAHLREHTPDASVPAAFRTGVRSGAGILAVVGALVGVAAALVEPSAERGVEALLSGVGGVVGVMLVIVVGIGVPATALVWLALWCRRREHPTAGVTGPDPPRASARGKVEPTPVPREREGGNER